MATAEELGRCPKCGGTRFTGDFTIFIRSGSVQLTPWGMRVESMGAGSDANKLEVEQDQRDLKCGSCRLGYEDDFGD